MAAQASRCLFQNAAANKDVVGIEGGDRQDADAGFGKRVQDGGKNADGGNFSFPSTVNALQRASHFTPWGTSTDGQTMESS